MSGTLCLPRRAVARFSSFVRAVSETEGSLRWQGAFGARVGASCIFLTALLATSCSHCAVTDNASDLTIPIGEAYVMHGARTYSHSVAVYGRLVVSPYTGAPGTGTLKLVAPDITVLPGGIIDADCAGFGAGEGPGVGVSPAGTAGSGAGYGDPGGKGYGIGARGGLPYGYASGEVHKGSGGLSTETATGGRGGGAIHLTASQSVTISGTITANGQDGESDPSGFAAGAGSGGGILIDGSGATVVIDGLVSAKGGNGGNGEYGGGGGSGGRVRILYGAGMYTCPGDITCMWGEAGVSQEMDYPPERGSGGAGGALERQATYTPPSVSLVEPELPFSATIKVRYTLTDAEADMCSLTVEYSVDRGATFKPATLAPISYGKWRSGIWDPYYPVYGTERRPYRADWRSSILWDSLKDIGQNRVGDIRIRVTATDGFEAPGIPGTSGPFAVDNRLVRPGPPKLEYRGPAFIGISINHGGIHPPAEFAILNVAEGRYVDAEGLSSSSQAVWRTEWEWGVVEIKDLTPNTAYSFEVKARDLSIGVETEFGPALSASTTPLGAFSEQDWNGIVFRLVVDKAVYQVAEPAEIQFIITNNKATRFYLQFPSACQFHFNVCRGLSCTPYFDLFCAAVITELELGPNETHVYSSSWGGAIWPGTYTLVAYLVDQPTPVLGVHLDVLGPLRKVIGGRLPTDTILTKQGSPFRVPEDLIVPRGMTLTIEPGVELLFDYATGPQTWSWSDRGAGLSVNGTLIARGTPEENIIFRSCNANPAPYDWQGITFSDLATDAVFDPQTRKYSAGCILEHCLIEHAVTALTVHDASPLIANCIIRNNGETRSPNLVWEPVSGIILGEDSRALFVNNTIVRNIGFISGSFTFVNSIIWHNVNMELENFSAWYCNIEGGYMGMGNINSDPLFVDLAHGDYHLQPDSPCISAGTTDVQGIPEFDMDGDPRISGATVDIGADEFADDDNDNLLDYLELLYFQSLDWGPDDDPDSDGLTVREELTCGTNPAEGDTDGDGIPDGKELAAGTDPRDPHCSLKVTALEPGDFATRIWWKSLPARQYRVQASDDMRRWQYLSPLLTPAGTTGMFVDNHDLPVRQRFYRIEAVP